MGKPNHPSWHSPTLVQLNWVKPNVGSLKFNCDATIESSLSSLAVVLRDWKGTVVLAISRKANTSIPFQAEAEAILWAVQLAINQRLENIYFESDSKTFVDALFGNLCVVPLRVQGCLAELLHTSTSHPHWSFRQINREANGAPHSLATWSLKNRM